MNAKFYILIVLCLLMVMHPIISCVGSPQGKNISNNHSQDTTVISPQCDIEYICKNGDSLYFYDKNLKNSLICNAEVVLVFSEDSEKNYKPYLKKVEITGIILMEEMNSNSFRSINCVDSKTECMCDSIEKYLEAYYKNPNTMLNGAIIVEFNDHKYDQGDIKINTNISTIYIYPYVVDN